MGMKQSPTLLMALCTESWRNIHFLYNCRVLNKKKFDIFLFESYAVTLILTVFIY